MLRLLFLIEVSGSSSNNIKLMSPNENMFNLPLIAAEEVLSHILFVYQEQTLDASDKLPSIVVPELFSRLPFCD